MLRKLLVSLGILVVILLLALWLLPSMVDSKKLLEPILAKVEEQSGIDIQVEGDVSLGLLPRPGITLGDIRIQLPDESSPTIEADSFQLGIRLLPLLSRQIDVDRFNVEKLALLNDDNSDAPAPELDLDGRFSYSESQQILTLDNVRADLRGLTPEPAELTLSGPIDVGQLVADLRVDLLHGEVSGDGSVRYAASESPQIDAKLHLNKFSPALYALAGPEAAAEAGAENSESEGAEDGGQTLPLDALQAMDTRADLSIDEVIWEGHKIKNFKARLRVVNGNAILPNVSGTIHGGKLKMKANLNSQPEIPRVNTEGTLTGVDIASLLAAEDIDPVMTGRATLSWKLHGIGNTTTAMSDSLRGPIKVSAEDAILTAVGIEQKLCAVVASVNREQLAAELPGSSTFDQLAATILLKDGEARLQPLTARLPQMGLAGTGTLDIKSQEFKARFNAKLSPDIETLDPACRVNERLTAIKWPVECAGELTGEPKDWCSVDSDEILKDIGENELKHQLEKEIGERYGEDAGAALKKLLGK